MALAEAHLNYEKELRKVEAELTNQLMKQFAHELHDNIGHLLTCLRLELENRKLDDPDLVTSLKSADTYLDETAQQLKLLSRSLNTDYVSKIGLVKAMELEVERQKQLKKLAISFNKRYSRLELDKNQELMIFRIFQEIITNALRHSGAKTLTISLKDDPHFELLFSDDGRGFNVEKMMLSQHASGLKNIIARSKMAGIECEISSESAGGVVHRLYHRN